MFIYYFYYSHKLCSIVYVSFILTLVFSLPCFLSKFLFFVFFLSP